jgi:hypothetical protein
MLAVIPLREIQQHRLVKASLVRASLRTIVQAEDRFHTAMAAVLGLASQV